MIYILQKDDYHVVESLHRYLYKKMNRIEPDFFVDPDNIEFTDNVTKCWDRQQSIVFVFEKNNNIVGYIRIIQCCTDENSAMIKQRIFLKIEEICVDKKHQKQGIGTQLLKKAIELSDQNSRIPLYIGTASKNKRALDLYRRIMKPATTSVSVLRV